MSQKQSSGIVEVVVVTGIVAIATIAAGWPSQSTP